MSVKSKKGKGKVDFALRPSAPLRWPTAWGLVEEKEGTGLCMQKPERNDS